jgi:hypothetical protein
MLSADNMMFFDNMLYVTFYRLIMHYVILSDSTGNTLSADSWYLSNIKTAINYF